MANKSKKTKAAPKKAASKKPAPKKASKAKATAKPTAKSAPKAKKAGSRGKRYTPKQKAKVLAYVAAVNAKKGRGGAAAASRKFGVNQITIGQWIKKDGASAAPAAAKKNAPKKTGGKRRGRPPGKKAASKAKASSSFAANLRRLADVHDAITKKEAELAALKNEYAALKGAL